MMPSRSAKIGFALEKLQVLLREGYDVLDDQQKCHDLTSSQCHTLLEVGGRGEVSLVDLADSLGLDASTLSRTIQRLVVLGLVIRLPGEKDRRYVRISLSDQGREAYETIGRLYYDFMNRVFGRIPARKRASVLESVGLFADAMKQANESRRNSPKGKKA